MGDRRSANAHAGRTRGVCGICAHACIPPEGAVGRCRARVAHAGAVVPLNYGKATSIALDPVEKKPLAAFHPGCRVLSVGSFGCNLSCPFCQNASIAQAGEGDAPWRFIAPEQLVERACSLRGEGCIGIAFTYNEPLVGFEFVRDASRLAHEKGLVNVLVSNGMVRLEELSRLDGLIDAANIDLKGFSQEFYDLCGGSYEAARATIAHLAGLRTCHVEVTTLVIPGLNDDDAQVEAAAQWLGSLDPSIVYHLTRFFPAHRMANRPPTPLATLERLRAAAAKHLPHVVLGNV